MNDDYDCQVISKHITSDQLMLHQNCVLLDFNTITAKGIFLKWYREEGRLLFEEYALKEESLNDKLRTRYDGN